jgi:pentatricopeptide repeat protein
MHFCDIVAEFWQLNTVCSNDKVFWQCSFISLLSKREQHTSRYLQCVRLDCAAQQIRAHLMCIKQRHCTWIQMSCHALLDSSRTVPKKQAQFVKVQVPPKDPIAPVLSPNIANATMLKCVAKSLGASAIVAAAAQLQQQRFAHKGRGLEGEHAVQQQQRFAHKGIGLEGEHAAPYKGRNERTPIGSLRLQQIMLREQIEAAGKRKDMQRVLDMIAQARISGPALNTHIYSAAIIVMARSRQVQEALQLFAEMQDEGIKPDPMTYNALIKACISSGTLDAAMQLFKEMQQRGVKPTVVTYNTLLKGHDADLCAVQQLFTAMKEGSIAPNTVTYNTLITVYSNSGQLDAAWQVYDEMMNSTVSHSDQTYGALITLCGRACESDRALQLFNELVKAGIQAAAIVCNSLITACGNGGN